jgi:hypothetical protein
MEERVNFAGSMSALGACGKGSPVFQISRQITAGFASPACLAGLLTPSSTVLLRSGPVAGHPLLVLQRLRPTEPVIGAHQDGTNVLVGRGVSLTANCKTPRAPAHKF